jgi:hypothetical protein
MNLGEIKTDLLTWLTVTARDVDENGVDQGPLPVEFGRSPKKVRTDPFVLVYRGPITKSGWDFPGYTFNESTGQYIEQMRGVRRLPIRFSFRAFNQSWEKSAAQFAEDFRNNLQSTESLTALAQTKLTLQNSSDLIATDYEMSGKLISQVEMTVYFGAAGYQRTPVYDAGYFQTVNFEGQNYLLDIDGNPIEDALGNPVIDLNILEFSVDSRIEP